MGSCIISYQVDRSHLRRNRFFAKLQAAFRLASDSRYSAYFTLISDVPDSSVIVAVSAS